jgi:hypothetical protein
VNANLLQLAESPGVIWDHLGLNLPPDLSFGEWERIGEKLQSIHKGILWAIGDWLNYGEHKYGEMYTQAIDATGYSVETLKKAKALGARFQRPQRTELSWSHHLTVAYLPPEERTEKLQQAVENHWSKRELQAAIKRPNRIEAKCFWDNHVLTQCAKHQRPIGECRVPVFDLDANNGNSRFNGSIPHDPPLR